jgi:hypothetical protein
VVQANVKLVNVIEYHLDVDLYLLVNHFVDDDHG